VKKQKTLATLINWVANIDGVKNERRQDGKGRSVLHDSSKGTGRYVEVSRTNLMCTILVCNVNTITCMCKGVQYSLSSFPPPGGENIPCMREG
jgi:hypothetical protein